MRWSREEYIELMTFGRVERPMFSELFGPLIGLDGEWRAQGASDDEISMVAFDWDYVPVAHVPANTGPRPMEVVTISESADELVQRDYLGRTVKLCRKTATLPLPLDFPVKTVDDWRAIKPRFEFGEWRIDWEGVDKVRRLQADGHLTVIHIPGAFDMPRELMGEELACMAYYDEPELMHDIVETMQKTSVEVLRRVCEKLRIDQLSVHEDFAGRSGPLVGPGHIAEYFGPHYRAAWDVVKSHGGRMFMQDTDGNINAVIDSLLECGLTAIHPMEPAAGMDMVALRKKYGTRLAMSGGIDKHVLRQSREAICNELEYKLQPCMWKGTVLGLDHRIPNGTPLENYRYYVELGREMLGLPRLDGKRRGWGRMAF